jgi:DNA polymerase III delta subunit
MKFKLKLLYIKCHVLEFTKDEAQKMPQMITQSFAEAFLSYGKHTLFTLEESVPCQTTYTHES